MVLKIPTNFMKSLSNPYKLLFGAIYVLVALLDHSFLKMLKKMPLLSITYVITTRKLIFCGNYIELMLTIGRSNGTRILLKSHLIGRKGSVPHNFAKFKRQLAHKIVRFNAS